MIQQDTFEIRLPQFAGPFDLLLFFIERDELDICDIQITKITDDFLGYIHQMNALNMELASEFIFVAATLIRIKAKCFYHCQKWMKMEIILILKRNLIQKLIEYKRFKLLAESFRQLEYERFMQEKRGNILSNRLRI